MEGRKGVGVEGQGGVLRCSGRGLLGWRGREVKRMGCKLVVQIRLSSCLIMSLISHLMPDRV